MKNKILFVVSFLFLLSLKAQNTDFELKNDEQSKQIFINYFKESNLNLATTTLEKYSGEVRKQLKESFKTFTDDFVKEIEDNQFIFDDRFINKAEEILSELLEKNSSYKKEIKILIAKHPTLNGYCLPNGTLVINMGVFYWLENDDQMAAIIAHELSHKILEHGIKSKVKYIEDNYSNKSKLLVKTINKNEIKKVDRAFDLFKSQLYENSKISQKHEYEADSLSYLLLKNTKYKVSEITSTMKLMIKYDSIKPTGLANKIYYETFNLPNQPFQDKWLKMEDFSQYNYDLYKEKINRDSISTHPEMDLRIERLESNYPDLKVNIINEGSESFKKLEKLAAMNIVPNQTDLENYGFAIYLCLLNLQNNEEEAHHKLWLGKIFQKVWDARKNYTLNRYLDRIDPKNHSESYQQFLSFMWNLKLEELKNIADFYQKSE